MRTCVACRRRHAADELVRLRAQAGALVKGAGPGRGAWVGPSAGCLELAASRGAIARALRVEVNADEVARLKGSWPTDPPACPYDGA